jgi:hypothetical protein
MNDTQLAAALKSIEETQQLLKATNITEASVTALTREDLQSDVAIAMSTVTPLRNRFQRVKGESSAHKFYRMEGTSTSGMLSLGTLFANMVPADGAIPTTVADPSKKSVSITYKNIADKYSFTYQAAAQGASFQDVQARKRYAKITNCMLAEEYFLINGDVDTSAYQFDGIKKQITTYGNTLNYAGFTPDDANLKLMEAIANQCKTIWDKGGQATSVVMSSVAAEALRKEIWYKTTLDLKVGNIAGKPNAVGFAIPDKMNFGYGDVDIIVSRYIPAYTYSGSDAYDIYLLDEGTPDTINETGGKNIQVVESIPMTEVKLGLTALEDNYVVFESLALQVTCPTFCGKIYNYQ